jgi:hypothetical protein
MTLRGEIFDYCSISKDSANLSRSWSRKDSIYTNIEGCRAPNIIKSMREN